MSLVASVLSRGTGVFWGVGKEGKPLGEGTNVSQDAPSVLQEQDPHYLRSQTERFFLE